MVFSKSHPPKLAWNINGCILEQINEFHYLGINILSNRSRKSHLNKACNKVLITFDQIKQTDEVSCHLLGCIWLF